MARPRKTDYFVCKTCKNEFRKKAYTPEVVERCQCPQCYTEEMTKKKEADADDAEFQKFCKSQDFAYEDTRKKVELLTKVPLPYPSHPSKPSIKNDATATQAREYAEKLEAYEKALPEYEKKMDEYRTAENKCHRWFRKWAVAECLPADLPEWQKNKVFAKAYEDGHGSGAYEVYIQLQELSDLFVKDRE